MEAYLNYLNLILGIIKTLESDNNIIFIDSTITNIFAVGHGGEKNYLDKNFLLEIYVGLIYLSNFNNASFVNNKIYNSSSSSGGGILK